MCVLGGVAFADLYDIHLYVYIYIYICIYTDIVYISIHEMHTQHNYRPQYTRISISTRHWLFQKYRTTALLRKSRSSHLLLVSSSSNRSSSSSSSSSGGSGSGSSSVSSTISLV